MFPHNGAFAEYCLVQDGIYVKVPGTLDMKEASTLGVGLTTVAQVSTLCTAVIAILRCTSGPLSIPQTPLAHVCSRGAFPYLDLRGQHSDRHTGYTICKNVKLSQRHRNDLVLTSLQVWNEGDRNV